MRSSSLSHVINQISAAKHDLRQYQPSSVDWVSRANATAKVLIPWLEVHASALQAYVAGVLNAPMELQRLWKVAQSECLIPESIRQAIGQQFEWADVLRESVSGETVSKVITKFMVNGNQELRSNGRSDYPDLYLSTIDYSKVPLFQRHRKGAAAEYGAARKGTEMRPVRVPDGLEIKSCRGSIRVDCHHPHAGLHLAIIFEEEDSLFTVTDILVAFLQASDYRESERNTTATTVKYSFNGERFVSLIRNQSE